jgi:hypothetical protein
MVKPLGAAGGGEKFFFPGDLKRMAGQGVNWTFTLNNPELDELGMIEALIEGGAKEYVFQLEKGESGTPHYQGFVSMVARQRATAMKKILPRAHWEQAKNPGAARNYCRKEESRVDGPWEWKRGKGENRMTFEERDAEFGRSEFNKRLIREVLAEIGEVRDGGKYVNGKWVWTYKQLEDLEQEAWNREMMGDAE